MDHRLFFGRCHVRSEKDVLWSARDGMDEREQADRQEKHHHNSLQQPTNYIASHTNATFLCSPSLPAAREAGIALIVWIMRYEVE
jgi:hypothetical protein